MSLGPLLLIQLAATAAMTGLIWFVQIVHYPLFDRVGREAFAVYEKDHQQRTGLVVAPLMALEMATAAWQIVIGDQTAVVLTAFGLLLVVWVTTAFVSIPCHHRLSQGFDESAHRRLVATNWIRTVAWTGRTVLVGWQMLQLGTA